MTPTHPYRYFIANKKKIIWVRIVRDYVQHDEVLVEFFPHEKDDTYRIRKHMMKDVLHVGDMPDEETEKWLLRELTR